MNQPKQPAVTTSISKTELPEWVNRAGEENYATAKGIAAQPFDPNTIAGVAGMSPLTSQALTGFQSGVGAESGAFQGSQNALQGLMSFNPSKVGTNFDPGSVAGTSLAPYLNPMTAEIENNALAAIDRAGTTGLNNNATNAIKNKAFGGSRASILDAVSMAETARARGETSANLRGQAYDRATGLLQGDINTRLQGRQLNQAGEIANQNASIQGANVVNNAATASANVATATQASRLQDLFSLIQGGNIQQTQNQSEINKAAEVAGGARANELENLNLLLSSLGLTPYNKTQSTTGTSQAEQKGTDWATLGLGMGTLLKGTSFLPMLSEDTEKTDIKKVGEVPGKPLGLFAFRYKGDPKNYPKSVGLMASEVEKYRPEAIKRIKKGKKTVRIVDYTKALAS